MSDPKLNQSNIPEEPEQEWIREFAPVMEEDLPADPERLLAEQMADEVSTCVALLHDVVEDTQWTIEELAAEFPQEVVDALRLLTHEEGVPYMEYVAAIADNATATRVKLEDLKHNMDPTRMCGNPAMMGRVSPEKAELYRQAWDYLSGRL